MPSNAIKLLTLLSGGVRALVDVTTFNQTFGSELVTNGTFTTNTTGWSSTGSPDTFEATGGRAHIVEGSAALAGMTQTVTISSGTLYLITFDFEVISGSLRVDYNASGISGNAFTGSGTVNLLFVAGSTSNNLLFRSNSVAAEFYIDNVSVRAVTFSTVQTTQANAVSDILFTQPGSPKLDDQVSLVYRHSGATNYWLVSLRYDRVNLQWDIYHRKVVSGTVTTLQTVNNVGTGITGLRIVTSGNDHTVYRQVSGVWTIVGTLQTDSALASATDLTTMYTTAAMTPTRLLSYPN